MPLPTKLNPEDISNLLERVEEETAAAEEDLEYAQHIVQEAGLTVEKSVLDGSRFAPDAMINSAPSNNGGAPQPMYKEAAAAAVHARQAYNPLRGSLSAYPIVLSTSVSHSRIKFQLF